MEQLDFTEKPSILVVDDAADSLTLISNLLRDKYKVTVANSSDKAMKIAAAEPHPDLILLDIMMPGMDGFEVCKRLKLDSRTMNIPVIFLTAKDNIEDEQKGLELGAVDYITKPISPPILLARVKTHLTLNAVIDLLRHQNDYLELEVAKLEWFPKFNVHEKKL